MQILAAQNPLTFFFWLIPPKIPKIRTNIRIFSHHFSIGCNTENRNLEIIIRIYLQNKFAAVLLTADNNAKKT